MAKVYKVSMYITDTDECSDIENLIEHGLNRYDLYPSFMDVKSSEEFEWDDDLEINNVECTKNDFEKYFQ